MLYFILENTVPAIKNQHEMEEGFLGKLIGFRKK